MDMPDVTQRRKIARVLISTIGKRKYTYTRDDLVAKMVAEKDAEIKRLREAVEMAWGYFDQCCQDQRNMVPNSAVMRDTLAAYLREKEGQS